MKDGVGNGGNQSSPRGCETKLSLAARNSFAPRRNSVHPVNTRKAPRWNSIIMRASPSPDSPRTPLYFPPSSTALLVSLWHTSSELVEYSYKPSASRWQLSWGFPQFPRHSGCLTLADKMCLIEVKRLVVLITKDQHTHWQSSQD